MTNTHYNDPNDAWICGIIFILGMMGLQFSSDVIIPTIDQIVRGLL